MCDTTYLVGRCGSIFIFFIGKKGVPWFLLLSHWENTSVFCFFWDVEVLNFEPVPPINIVFLKVLHAVWYRFYPFYLAGKIQWFLHHSGTEASGFVSEGGTTGWGIPAEEVGETATVDGLMAMIYWLSRFFIVITILMVI